jgi:hypothetical protein
MIISRIIAPASKLATARMLDDTTASASTGKVLGLGPVAAAEREQILALMNGILRLGDDRVLKAAAGNEARSSAVLCNGHLRAKRPRKGAVDRHQRCERRSQALLSPIQQLRQHILFRDNPSLARLQFCRAWWGVLRRGGQDAIPVRPGVSNNRKSSSVSMFVTK